MNQQEAAREAQELRITQAVKKTFDYTISFVAKAGKSGSVSIPINSDGDFHELGYNIRYTENSTVTTGEGDDAVTKNFSNLKLMFSSQTANGQQSNDKIPVQLIATPGTDNNPRYGTRPFDFTYPENDTLVINYDNLAPEVLDGEVYEMKDERVDIVFNGKLYHTK